jgi:hypothetical protein
VILFSSSILSYCGGVTLGVTADSGLLEDPNVLVKYFMEEVQELQDAIEQIQTSN